MIREFSVAIGVLLWIVGLVLAHGFWSTVIAIFIPPWAFYLVVERAMLALGWVS